MNRYADILPGSRVRAGRAFLGTVERLEHCGDAPNGEPDCMVVRSDDGRWRYRIPLMLVSGVARAAFAQIVTLDLAPEDLTQYIVEETNTMRQPSDDIEGASREPIEDQDTITVPLASEQLVARKTPVVRGHLKVHKRIKTEEQRLEVPVYHEEVVVEHIPADEYDPRMADNPNDVIIPLTEERLVVQKQTVVSEYLRIRKARIEKRYEVHGDVRREILEFDEEKSPDLGDDNSPLLRPEGLHPEQAADTAETQR